VTATGTARRGRYAVREGPRNPSRLQGGPVLGQPDDLHGLRRKALAIGGPVSLRRTNAPGATSVTPNTSGYPGPSWHTGGVKLMGADSFDRVSRAGCGIRLWKNGPHSACVFLRFCHEVCAGTAACNTRWNPSRSRDLLTAPRKAREHTPGEGNEAARSPREATPTRRSIC